mmetsp:Transcript_35039/g.112871  ORF Transcript_35039/g.112871 Transcript_35039/m.112871 type:complete len:263 (+) Transcript_35039:1974-2762(+)
MLRPNGDHGGRTRPLELEHLGIALDNGHVSRKEDEGNAKHAHPHQANEGQVVERLEDEHVGQRRQPPLLPADCGAAVGDGHAELLVRIHVGGTDEEHDDHRLQTQGKNLQVVVLERCKHGLHDQKQDAKEQCGNQPEKRHALRHSQYEAGEEQLTDKLHKVPPEVGRLVVARQNSSGVGQLARPPVQDSFADGEQQRCQANKAGRWPAAYEDKSKGAQLVILVRSRVVLRRALNVEALYHELAVDGFVRIVHKPSAVERAED